MVEFPDRCSNYYELLGLKPFETDCRLIDARARALVRRARRYQTGPLAARAGRHLELLAAAAACLLDEHQKRDYDEALRDQFGLPPVEVVASYIPGGAAERRPGRPAVLAALALAAGALGLALAAWVAR